MQGWKDAETKNAFRMLFYGIRLSKSLPERLSAAKIGFFDEHSKQDTTLTVVRTGTDHESGISLHSPAKVCNLSNSPSIGDIRNGLAQGLPFS